VLAVAALAAIVLGTLAAEQPGLRFVDFIPFSVRARTLLSAPSSLVHPLYPIGYPALLRLGHALTGDVLLTGKGLSVLGGAIAAGAVARWVSPWAGLWLLAQPTLLRWGATEGTDTLAAALAIAALAAARRSPLAAGLLLGLGCLTRYTVVTAAPVVLILSTARGTTLAGFLAATAPHWAVALWIGAPLLPDQSSNVAIGGHTGSMLSVRFLSQLPVRLWMAGFSAVRDPMTAAGLVGLVIGLLRRDRRAAALGAAALLHLGAVSLAFSNDRLVLPATLMIAAGVVWLLPRWWLLLPAAVASLVLSLPQAREPSPTVSSLAKVVAEVEGLEGPFLTTSPWFYTREGGWVASGILVRRIPGDSRRLTPTAAHRWGTAAGVRHMAVDIGRVRRSYPGLVPLLGRSPPQGYRKVGQSPGWLIFALD
jgi:hypothetical protein